MGWEASTPLAAQGGDDVADLDTRLVGRLPLEDLGHANAVTAGQAELIRHVGDQHLRDHTGPWLVGLGRLADLLFLPNLDDRQQLLLLAVELDEDGNLLCLSFGQFLGDCFQRGYVGHVLPVHFENHVTRLQGEFGGSNAAAFSHRLDQDALGVWAVMFQGHPSE